MVTVRIYFIADRVILLHGVCTRLAVCISHRPVWNIRGDMTISVMVGPGVGVQVDVFWFTYKTVIRKCQCHCTHCQRWTDVASSHCTEYTLWSV